MSLNLAWVRFSLVLLVWGVSPGLQGAIAGTTEDVLPATVLAQAEPGDRPAASPVQTPTVSQVDELLKQGKLQFRRAEFKQAIATYQQILGMATQPDQQHVRVEALIYLIDINLWSGQYSSAETLIQQALKLSRQAGIQAQEAEILASLSALHRLQGNYPRALKEAQRAVEMAKRVGDLRVETRSQFMLGIALYHQANYSMALDVLQKAANLAKTEKNQDEVTLLLNWIALTQLALKDIQSAAATMQQQLQLSQTIGFKLAVYGGLWVVASIQQQKKQMDLVVQSYQKQLEIAQSADNPWFQRSTLLAIGWFHVNQKQLPRGLEFLQKALVVARAIDDVAIADTQNQIGVAYYRAEQYSKALEVLLQTLDIYQKTNKRTETAQVWKNIADAYYQQKQYPKALEAYQRAGEIYRSLKQSPGESDKQNTARRNEVEVLQRIALVYERQSQFSQAFNIYQQALINLRESDQNRGEEAGVFISIGQMYDKQADSTKALEAYQTVIELTKGLQGVELWKRLAFSSIGRIYRFQEKYVQAIEVHQKEWAIAKVMEDAKAEQSAIQSILVAYEAIGVDYSGNRRYAEALEAFQTGLKLARETQQKRYESRALRFIGSVYHNQNEYRQALQYFQQSLAISNELKIDDDIAATLWYSGLSYYALSEYPKALEALQQASQIHEKQGDRAQKIRVSFKVSDIYSTQGKHREARDIRQQALAFYQRVVPRFQTPITTQNLDTICDPSNQFDEGNFLFNNVRRLCGKRQQLGDGSAAAMLEGSRQSFLKSNRKYEAIALDAVAGTYISMGRYDIAIDYRQRAMQTFQDIDAPREVASSLLSLAGIYERKGDFTKAIALTQQALEISQKLGERSYTAWSLWSLAGIYMTWGRYAESLELNQKSLKIYRSIEDTSSVADTLTTIGIAYGKQGQYAQERDYYQQALALRQKLGDRPGVAIGLANLGGSYRSLGQYSQSLEYYQNALNLARELGNRSTEAVILNRIGRVYLALKQYDRALNSQQQSLEINRRIESRVNQISTLQEMGRIYHAQGQFLQAATYLQQSLALSQESGVRSEEVKIRNSLGKTQLNLGQFSVAADLLQQGLLLAQETGDRETEASILNNLGELFIKQNQPELTIVFYKQSVSVFETIRQGIRKLDRTQQESYTQTIAGTYRALADLLLKQNRILEAQQILDLLKVQELNDYLTNVRGAGKPLTILPPETEILKKYGELQKSAIELGKEFNQLEDLARIGTLTPAQRDRKNQLLKLQQELNQQFNQFTQRSDVVALTRQLTPEVAEQNVNLKTLDGLRDELRRLNAVMIYPLILDDRLELIITTPDSPPLRRTTTVKREELNRAIAEFRQALQDPTQDAKPIAQKLYTWIIQPLEADLKQANAKTIIYAPDAQLRYIPLAALHDGQQWLVQRFRINNITAQSLTNFTQATSSRLRVLAGASAAAHEVTIGNTRQSFKALPFAAQEVNNVARLLPNTTKLINQDFSLDGFTSQMNEFAIVHFATHASFVPEDPTQSFILFGDGKTANLKDIGNWTLKDVDLVVLSACETAVGIQALGTKALGRGEEILGLGYQFQIRGARATIASLWSVDDGGTQALISAFYQQLQSGKLTKAEALQQAQIVLLNTKTRAAPIPSDRLALHPKKPNQPTRKDQIPPGYSHPYYWAPFILIGNGL